MKYDVKIIHCAHEVYVPGEMAPTLSVSPIRFPKVKFMRQPDSSWILERDGEVSDIPAHNIRCVKGTVSGK